MEVALSGNYFPVFLSRHISGFNVKVCADYIRHLILSYQMISSGTVTAIFNTTVRNSSSLIRSVRFTLGFQTAFLHVHFMDSSLVSLAGHHAGNYLFKF